MIYALLVIIVLLIGIIVVLNPLTKDATLLRKARGMAVAAMPFMRDVEEVAIKLRDVQFVDPQFASFSAVLYYQLNYLHNMLVLLAAEHAGNPVPALDFIHGLAAPSVPWMEYGNTLVAALNERLAEDLEPAQIADVEKLKTLIISSMHAIAPLQKHLRREFRKSGVTWTSQE